MEQVNKQSTQSRVAAQTKNIVNSESAEIGHRMSEGNLEAKNNVEGKAV